MKGKIVKNYEFYVPGPSLWFCEHCLIDLKVPVGVTQPPEHICAKRRNFMFPLTQKIKHKEIN
ncbi:hypothetical protein [Flavobacterium sp.]|uniref:hypothetical protein n=1 Tax=Flavobacterium sp. TaxID=239 RepID=UPI003BCB5D55